MSENPEPGAGPINLDDIDPSQFMSLDQPAEGEEGPSEGLDLSSSKELLGGFQDLMAEFEDEFKLINAEGEGASSDLDKEHEEFVRANWTFTLENIIDLFSHGWKKNKFKGIIGSFKFIVEIVLKPQRIKELIFQMLIPYLKSIPKRMIAKILAFPGAAKEFLMEKDKEVWKKRGIKASPYLFLLAIGIGVLLNWKTFFPDEDYDDLSEVLANAKKVDLNDSTREIENLLTLPSILAYLREDESVYRLLQVDIVVECDSLLTLAQLNSEMLLSEARSRIASHFGLFSYNDLHVPEKKNQVKQDIARIIEEVAPQGRIYNVYFTKWVFAPIRIHKPDRY